MRRQILLLIAALLSLCACITVTEKETAALPHERSAVDGTSFVEASDRPSRTPAAAEATKASPTPFSVPKASLTAEPAATPSPTPKAITDEALDSGALDSFFLDSALIGDSMTGGLFGYAARQRNGFPDFLGDMQFIYASAYTLDTAYHVERGERFPWLKYRGQSYSVSDLVRAMDVRTAFLLFGVNDIQLKSTEENIAQIDQIVRNIQEKSPDTQVVLITIPPVTESYAAQQGFSETNHREVNDALRAYCDGLGLDYVELYDRICGEDGYLKPEYCCDGKFHFSTEGNAAWTRAFREYARVQYDCGAWALPDDAELP